MVTGANCANAKKEYPFDEAMRISHEAIYSYLYVLPRGKLKKELLNYLRQKHKRRRKRSRMKESPSRKLEDMLSIEERPAEVADRTVPGHWEGDILIGRNRQSAMGSLVERTTRTTILVPLQSKKAREVRKAFAREARRLPKQMRLTMTYDQGREMAPSSRSRTAAISEIYIRHLVNRIKKMYAAIKTVSEISFGSNIYFSLFILF